jgi:hypothetical protein
MCVLGGVGFKKVLEEVWREGKNLFVFVLEFFDSKPMWKVVEISTLHFHFFKNFFSLGVCVGCVYSIWKSCCKKVNDPLTN